MVSGTTSFALAAQDVVYAALRGIGVYGSQDSVPASDMTNCLQALNIIAKELALNGLPLWKVEDITIPCVAGQAVYNLSTITTSTLPLRLLDAYIMNNASGARVSLQIVSRYDFNLLGSPNTPGIPNQLFYDPQLGAGEITVYGVPQDATYTIHVVVQLQIDDFNALTDTPDFPQEALLMLKWRLMDEIALEYQTDAASRREITQKATMYTDKFFASQQEQVPVMFTPSSQGVGR